MTFMEMIAQLDGKHMARREEWSKQLYVIMDKDNDNIFVYMYGDCPFILYMAWDKDDFLATDWIIEKIEE